VKADSNRVVAAAGAAAVALLQDSPLHRGYGATPGLSTYLRVGTSNARLAIGIPMMIAINRRSGVSRRGPCFAVRLAPTAPPNPAGTPSAPGPPTAPSPPSEGMSRRRSPSAARPSPTEVAYGADIAAPVSSRAQVWSSLVRSFFFQVQNPGRNSGRGWAPTTCHGRGIGAGSQLWFSLLPRPRFPELRARHQARSARGFSSSFLLHLL